MDSNAPDFVKRLLKILIYQHSKLRFFVAFCLVRNKIIHCQKPEIIF